jgi:hypothetical protein
MMSEETTSYPGIYHLISQRCEHNRAHLNILGLPKKHTLPKSDSGPIWKTVGNGTGTTTVDDDLTTVAMKQRYVATSPTSRDLGPCVLTKI